MLEAGEPCDSRTAELTVEESAGSLENILAHLDPQFMVPSIDTKAIESLLEMAHKYKVGFIFEWFEREAACRRPDSITNALDEAFIIAHPILALSPGMRYNIITTI